MTSKTDLESILEFLLPPPMGLKLMDFSAARLMYFYTGTDIPGRKAHQKRRTSRAGKAKGTEPCWPCSLATDFSALTPEQIQQRDVSSS
jgi:hypothetical protein